MESMVSLLIIVAIATCTFRPIRTQDWTFQQIGEGWQADESTKEEKETMDYRYIKYRVMMSTGYRFKSSSLVSSVQLVVDETRNQLLVGDREILFRLNLTTLDELQRYVWTSDNKTQDVCKKRGQTPAACHNFIRVLLLLDDIEQVFVCGTNAFNPECTWRNVSNLTDEIETADGRGICPFNPDYNATALMTSYRDLYAATVIDSSARDPAISRRLGPSVDLRTTKQNSKWLNEPNFVSTYEIGHYVYFFFRETAVEFINCGKVEYSRVARVCKTDKGGSYTLSNTWTSFLKARLNCSLPGKFPFYFDELQSTFYSEDEELIYAVFSTPQNSIAGSAVCVYNMSALNAAFDGPFKHQETPQSAWIRNPNNFSKSKCGRDGGTKRSSVKSPHAIMSAKKYQLMDQAVLSRETGPLIMRENERWTHIVVDHVLTRDGFYDVLFLATENGKIRKMIRMHAINKTCLIEEIKIVENGHRRPVENMKISTEMGAIYIATEGNILKIPVQRCYRFTDSSMCINAQDPYCGWDTRTQTCTPAPDGDPTSEFWEQDFRRCPVMDYPVPGGWSDFSPWSDCLHRGPNQSTEKCLCRSRACDRPRPANNGMKCRGHSVEVTNCTVNGQWTEWSSWSACSQSCGFATKERFRQCGNPSPKFGGSDCLGNDKQTDFCNGLPECPLVPVDGRWSIWSGWSSCTRKCNSGIQTRKRACDRPRPTRGGRFCNGNREEWRMCNTHKCDEKARISPWTEWIQTNRTQRGYFQQRFRFTCRANVEKSTDIKTSFAKSQAQFCYNNQRGCYSPKQLANTITSIDTFSSVDRVLKKYCRKRRRLFKKYCKCRTLGVFLVCQKCGFG